MTTTCDFCDTEKDYTVRIRIATETYSSTRVPKTKSNEADSEEWFLCRSCGKLVTSAIKQELEKAMNYGLRLSEVRLNKMSGLSQEK